MTNQSNPRVRMLTINQAAEYVPGLTRYRIREMCIRGEIPCLMAGRKYLICEQVLVQHLTAPHMGDAQGGGGPIRRIEA